MLVSSGNTVEGLDPLLQQRPTINPYRYAARLVWDRLCWDLNWKSWRSRRRLHTWRNKHQGEKAVIVCNGPSLLKTNLDLLKGVFTFGLNKIDLLFDKTDWRPSCIVAVNKHVIVQNAHFYNTTTIPLFLSFVGSSSVALRPNIAFLHISDQHKLARDCSVSINSGYTVTVVAMQLAFHVGFSDIALIGCDHNFAEKGPGNMTVKSGGVDKSHFHPKYFSGGALWQLPDLVQSELFYQLALNLFNAYGKRIVNCTEGGNLDIFPRLDLAHWVNDRLQ